jgi:dTDP-4-dehydrorhamnose 3,5-epimerase
MEFIEQAIPDVMLIKPRVHGDERGYFVETFRQDKLEQALGYTLNFVQDNESKSSRGVLRGLHYQLAPYAQSKLVRVIAGTVMDVAVDIRAGSPTYGEHVTVKLSADNKQQLFIPRGFAHGFLVLSETAIFAYKVDNYYSPECDRGIAFNDPQLGIHWQLPTESLQLSPKDTQQVAFSELAEAFDFNINYYA